MTMSINWTRASLQENRSLSQKITRSTKAVNSYTLPKKFLCCLHSDNSQLSTDYPQKRLSTSSKACWNGKVVAQSKTVECSFKRITANLKFILEGPLSGQISTEISTKREVIAVASASESEKAGDIGFIGEGFTKCGIYVCLTFSYFTNTRRLIRKLQDQV